MAIRSSTVPNSVVPITLNIRWMTVVLLAFLLVPTLARSAVIQVPMFCPKSTNTALWILITPPMASAWRMPTDAEEDWITAVNTAPTRIPRMGLENLVTIWMNVWESRSGTMASLIIPIPMNSTPIPAMMPPTCWIFLFFTKIRSMTPTNAISGARAPMSRAISWPVMVVPTLAPMIIHTACFNVIRPELTNPTVMTVVADEDWIKAVIPAPTSTPKKRLAVRRSNICFIRLPATASRLLLIICMPYINSARPPSRLNTNSTPMCFLLLSERIGKPLYYHYMDNVEVPTEKWRKNKAGPAIFG